MGRGTANGLLYGPMPRFGGGLLATPLRVKDPLARDRQRFERLRPHLRSLIEAEGIEALNLRCNFALLTFGGTVDGPLRVWGSFPSAEQALSHAEYCEGLDLLAPGEAAGLLNLSQGTIGLLKRGQARSAIDVRDPAARSKLTDHLIELLESSS